MSAPSPLVLGADVGGTGAKLALGRFGTGESPDVVALRVYPSRNFETLERIVEVFLNDFPLAVEQGPVRAACFAVAGPVEHGRATLTNLPWQPEEDALARHFRFPRVAIINDFAAAGLGIAHLSAADLLTLQPGNGAERETRVVVGAGTGLGVALLEWDEGRYEIHPSEAGHMDFAPIDSLQDGLLAHLRREFPRVSYERVLSGRGIGRVLEFLAATGAGAPSAALEHAMQRTDPAKAITEFALAGRDALAVRALDLFASAYGSFAGNMALTMLAHGGVYVAGGIAPKIAAKLEDGSFISAFKAKGRFRTLLEKVPVHVVMNEHVGLYGALGEAARLAAEA